MADVNEQAWGLIEWACTTGSVVILGIWAHIKFFLKTKWQKDDLALENKLLLKIEDSIKKYHNGEEERRLERAKLYVMELENYSKEVGRFATQLLNMDENTDDMEKTLSAIKESQIRFEEKLRSLTERFNSR